MPLILGEEMAEVGNLGSGRGESGEWTEVHQVEYFLLAEAGAKLAIDASANRRDELGQPDVLGIVSNLGDGPVFEVGACLMRQCVVYTRSLRDVDVYAARLLLCSFSIALQPLVRRLYDTVLARRAHKRRLALQELLVASVEMRARVDHLLAAGIRQLVRAQSVFVVLQEGEFIGIGGARVLYQADGGAVEQRLAHGGVPATVARQDRGEAYIAVLGGLDIDFGGHRVPERVLAPEVRRLGAAAVSVVDGVARLAGCGCSRGPGEGQRSEQGRKEAEGSTGRSHRD